VLPVPGFGPKLLLGGERAQALLFDSLKVRPAALLADGYEFEHTGLEDALHAALER
jgi:NAD dependent epimerase/dehydratase family enzyme